MKASQHKAMFAKNNWKIKVQNTCPCGRKCQWKSIRDSKDKNITCPKCQAKDNKRQRQANAEYIVNTKSYQEAKEEYVTRRANGESVGNFKYPLKSKKRKMVQ